MLPGMPTNAATFALWQTELGGANCYGRGAPFDACGDGYGDQYLGYPPEDSGGCVGQKVTGLPYAPTPAQRTAHIGRVVWGRGPGKGDGESKACHLNRLSWEGFTETRILRSQAMDACVVLRIAKP